MKNDNQETFSTCQVYLDIDCIVTRKDKIVLSNGVSPEILLIERPKDEFGDVYAIIINTR